jgi:hypothetical protein
VVGVNLLSSTSVFPHWAKDKPIDGMTPFMSGRLLLLIAATLNNLPFGALGLSHPYSWPALLLQCVPEALLGYLLRLIYPLLFPIEGLLVAILIRLPVVVSRFDSPLASYRQSFLVPLQRSLLLAIGFGFCLCGLYNPSD